MAHEGPTNKETPVAKSKAEQKAIAEAQRREHASVIDLAREGGMQGNRPAGGTVTPAKETAAKEK